MNTVGPSRRTLLAGIGTAGAIATIPVVAVAESHQKKVRKGRQLRCVHRTKESGSHLVEPGSNQHVKLVRDGYVCNPVQLKTKKPIKAVE